MVQLTQSVCRSQFSPTVHAEVTWRTPMNTLPHPPLECQHGFSNIHESDTCISLAILEGASGKSPITCLTHTDKQTQRCESQRQYLKQQPLHDHGFAVPESKAIIPADLPAEISCRFAMGCPPSGACLWTSSRPNSKPRWNAIEIPMS